MPLSDDCLSRDGLRALATATLLAAGTTAGTRVFEPRDWPTDLNDPEQWPAAMLVTTPAEHKQGMGPGIPQFTTTVTLVLLGRVAAVTAELADAALCVLLAEAEEAILCTPAMVAPVQQFSSVDVETTVTARGEMHVAEGYLMIACELYQLFEPNAGVPLTGFDATVPASGAGAPVKFSSTIQP